MTTVRSSNKSLLFVAAAAATLAAAPLIWVARAQPPAPDAGAPRAASEDARSGQGQPKDYTADRAAPDSRAKVRRDGPPAGGWGGGPFVPGWGQRAFGMRPAPIE